MKRLCLIALLLTLAVPASADEVLKFYAGANGAWFDDSAKPSDFEIGGNARASLSPHISLVGSTYYGFGNSYLRGSAGGRITATDVNDPNFSVGVGFQYHASSEPATRREGWAPDVSVGWKPQPEQWPAVILVAQGSYMLDGNDTSLLVGVRYNLAVGK